MNIEFGGCLVIMSQVMVMVLLVVLSGVGSGVDEGYYPPGTGAAWQPPPSNPGTPLSPAPIVDPELRRIITDDIL